MIIIAIVFLAYILIGSIVLACIDNDKSSLYIAAKGYHCIMLLLWPWTTYWWLKVYKEK